MSITSTAICLDNRTCFRKVLTFVYTQTRSLEKSLKIVSVSANFHLLSVNHTACSTSLDCSFSFRTYDRRQWVKTRGWMEEKCAFTFNGKNFPPSLNYRSRNCFSSHALNFSTTTQKWFFFLLSSIFTGTGTLSAVSSKLFRQFFVTRKVFATRRLQSFSLITKWFGLKLERNSHFSHSRSKQKKHFLTAKGSHG